ncbi:MAG: hypothetical protein ACREAU_00145 [Nitrosopumilaceae archaeon]
MVDETKTATKALHEEIVRAKRQLLNLDLRLKRAESRLMRASEDIRNIRTAISGMIPKR